MYKGSKQVYTLACIKVQSNGHTHFIGGHFCGNKNLPTDKMSGRSKVVLDKTEF